MENRTTQRTGTREWSDHSVNCCIGCSNGCLYCYARFNAVRFGWLDRMDDWTQQIARIDALKRITGRRYPGRVMFPTMHDITPGNYSMCLQVLEELLRNDNDVLLVTKPRLDLVKQIALAWRRNAKNGPHGPSLEIRCTITCFEDSVRSFWEPFAPTIAERHEALAYVHGQGIETSVVMEPLLQADGAAAMVAMLSPLVTRTIWIGKANQLRARTAWVAPSAWVRRRRPNLAMRLDSEIAAVEAGQTDAKVWEIYKQLRENPKIRWKDSYRQVLGLERNEPEP